MVGTRRTGATDAVEDATSAATATDTIVNNPQTKNTRKDVLVVRQSPRFKKGRSMSHDSPLTTPDDKQKTKEPLFDVYQHIVMDAKEVGITTPTTSTPTPTTTTRKEIKARERSKSDASFFEKAIKKGDPEKHEGSAKPSDDQKEQAVKSPPRSSTRKSPRKQTASHDSHESTQEATTKASSTENRTPIKSIPKSATKEQPDVQGKTTQEKTPTAELSTHAIDTETTKEINQHEKEKRTTPLTLTSTNSELETRKTPAINTSRQITATNKDDKIKANIMKTKTQNNQLTSFIPGYTAPLRLDSSSLNNQRPGLEALRKRALATDNTTAAYVKGTVANRQHVSAVLSSAPNMGTGLVASSFKKGPKGEARTDAGDKWFGMVPTPLTEDVKRDLTVIRNRNYLDPKRFYKSSDKPSQFLQVGTVVEGTGEYFSSRLTKKQRRANLTEELMADPTAADYTKRKYQKMMSENEAKSKKQNWHKKKRGKRQHF